MSEGKLAVLWPLFRYSAMRDAYVLRLIGNSLGPVLVVARERPRRGLSEPAAKL